MKVKLLTSRCGHAPSKIPGGPFIAFAQNIGDIVEVEQAEGERMVAAGQATEIEAAEGRGKRS